MSISKWEGSTRRLIVQQIAKEKHFSMARLEREAHLDRQTARRVWRDPSYNARPATLEKIARALGVHASELFREEDEVLASSPQPETPMTIFTPPLTIFTPPLTEQDTAHPASILKALAEPTRLWIVSQLNRYERLINVEELTAAYFSLQPTISHHLRVLRSAGLISHYKKKQNSYYYLNRGHIQNVGEFLLSTLLTHQSTNEVLISSQRIMGLPDWFRFEHESMTDPQPETLFTPLLTEHEFAHEASILKALAEPTRLQIVSQLNRYERLINVEELASVYRVARSTISSHLYALQAVGLISHYRDERWTYYYLNREKIAKVSDFLIHTLIAQELSDQKGKKNDDL